MRRRKWKAVGVLLAILVVGYLFVVPTLRFRLWMGERSMARQDYPAAILWFSRALRASPAPEDSRERRRLQDRLYQAFEGFTHWEFDSDRLAGWYAGFLIDELKLQDGFLTVNCTGDDPYLEVGMLQLAPARPYRFSFRLRCRAGERAKVYW